MNNNEEDNLSRYLRQMELQGANQNKGEIKSNNRQVDQNAEVWRYLVSNDGSLVFDHNHSVDYVELRESMDYLYKVLDFIYDIVDYYLSS